MTSLPLCTSGWGWLLFITSLVVFVLVNFLLYFLYFPLMISVLLLSVSTVTARVSSHRFPSNGKLCTHGIIFEWPPPPPIRQIKIKCTLHTKKYDKCPWPGRVWSKGSDWLILWLIVELANKMPIRKTNGIWPHGLPDSFCNIKITSYKTHLQAQLITTLCINSIHHSNCIQTLILELFTPCMVDYLLSSVSYSATVISMLCISYLSLVNTKR